jgi:hypothetical protein
MEAAMSGNDVYNTLTPETLGYIDGVVEPTEGFARIASRNFVTGCLTDDVTGEARSYWILGFKSVVKQRAV